MEVRREIYSRDLSKFIFVVRSKFIFLQEQCKLSRNLGWFYAYYAHKYKYFPEV